MFKYTNLQHKVKDEKATIVNLQEEFQELKQQTAAKLEAADKRYQELSEKRVAEMETAMAVERSLRDHFDRMDQEWRQ